MRSVWVLIGRTESGDDIGPDVFDYKPNSEQINEVLRGYDDPSYCQADIVACDVHTKGADV